VDGPAAPLSEPARDPGLGWAVLAGVIPGVIGAVLVHTYRLIVGRATTDEESLARFAFWLIMGAVVALAVSLVTIVAVPRSGAAVGLVTGGLTATAAALGTVAANTFLLGNILDLSFWWTTVVTTFALWLACYVVLLPVTLIVWPGPWKNFPGWLLTVLTTVFGGLAATITLGVALALR
jgi:hypothetical protein